MLFFHQFKAGILSRITDTIRNTVPVVATGKAVMAEWQPRQTATGSARAVKGADMAAEIGGVVDEIDFESGQTVQAGTVLLRLRPNDDDAKLHSCRPTPTWQRSPWRATRSSWRPGRSRRQRSTPTPPT